MTTSASAPSSPVPRISRRLALSPSRASDFRQCPLLYRLRAIDRIPQPPTLAMVRGTLVHAVLEELLQLPCDSRTVDSAFDLLQPSWNRVLSDMTDGNRLDLDAAGTDKLFDQSRSLLRGYFSLEDPQLVTPHACELQVEVDLQPDVPLRGFVDRVDEVEGGELRVVDYKTGRAPGAGYEAKALFQMKFYALALWKLRGIVPQELRLMYLGSSSTLTYEPDVEELDRFSRTVVALWKAILTCGKTGDFRPKKSTLCTWCEHQSRCPAFGNSPPDYPGWPDPPQESVVAVGS